ncbi:hypothetical protein [Bacillus sp. CDB3]|nr:hypothetical protein [Bacillus sp. CDB3]
MAGFTKQEMLIGYQKIVKFSREKEAYIKGMYNGSNKPNRSYKYKN